MITTDHIILVFAWLAYVILHSVFAALWFKSMVRRLSGERMFKYYRLAYSIFASLSLILILVYQFSIESILLFSRTLPVIVISVVFSLAGLIIMLACIRKYFMNLSGVDVLTKKESTQVLEENGLHGYVRHPLYSGTLLFIWSMFGLFPYLHNLIACLVITLYTIALIPVEERKLLMEYGESYRKYSSRIPMLIPSFSKLLSKSK